ncbi:MAG: cache domain-containing protein [Desulfobacter sp.]|nr:MAG: cache domain-containing protein [Desulfobacter sp.]
MIKKTLLTAAVIWLAVLPLTGSAEDLTAQLCKEKVIAAANLLGKEGRQAFDKIKDPKGDFRFAGGSGYVWIHSLDGIMLMHPISPSLDGKGLYNLQDKNGVYFFMAFNEMVEENGAGWVPYSWPKPGKKAPSPKVSYVKLAEHGDEQFVVGAGMYDVTPAAIKSMFPDDPIYEQ